MIKFNFILGWVILSILFTFPYRVSGQISKTISFDKAGIERRNLKKGGKAYESVMFKESFRSRDVGKPDLPVFYYRFYIPKGQVVTDIKFKSIKQDDIQLTSDLAPVQHPVITNFGSSDTVFDVPDTKVYNTDSFYPDKQADVLSTDFIDGNLQIVTVEVYPMQYQPRQKKLRLSSDVEISLVTSSNPDSKSTLTLVVPKFHDTESINLLKSLVQNPGDVPVADVPVAQTASYLKSATITWTVPFYEYVIVTSRALKPAFSEFLTWKKRKGYNAGIVCIEDILADPTATGDAISNLNDSAGKLRQYLLAGFTNSNPKTKWALLGGDYSVVPIRYGCGSEDTWNLGSMIDEQKVPTDLYFSAMNGNWNADGDIYTGEDLGDQVWFSIDVYVGRLLCTSETDVKNWTRKLLMYEQNPGNGNYSYLTKSLFTEADYIGTTDPMFLPSIFTTRDVKQESPSDDANWPTYPKGADAISLLNSGYGLYSNFNHGSPMGFGTATHGINLCCDHDVHYGVTAVDDYDNHDEYNHMYTMKPEPNNGFDNLTNTNNPFLIYSVSCTNMPFDDYDTYSGCRNLGESFTCMRLTGGPAYLVNTREGSNVQNYFFRTFLSQIQTTNHIGMAEATSKIGGGYKDVLSHNIIGCPEMPMWTATPTLFNGSLSENGTSVTVNTGGVVADKICIMSALNDGYFQVQPGVSTYTFTNVPKPYYVTITKSNYIPFRNSLLNVYIQNKTLSSTAYLNCQTVSAGYNVDANQTVGNVVIQNGANITFDATGDILLDNGFEVQVGATFEAK